MAGTQTNNFDLVIELAEDALKIWLSALFDGTGPQNSQGNIFEQIFGSSTFNLTVAMDRPGDIPNLPAGATDLLDVHVDVTGRAAIRMVVGLRVDRALPERDRVFVDFANSLHFLSVSLVGISLPGADLAFRTFLSSSLGAVELFGADVDRAGADPQKTKELDLRIIDDISAADRDALALLLNFGGSTGGNRNGFTASALDPGETGGIFVFFGWICRIMAPRIEAELGLAPGSVVTSATSCEFNGDAVLDEEEDVHLKRLAILLVDGAIRVECVVTKSGFCYSATGTVDAEMTVGVFNSELKLDWEAGDPDVDISIPWECWLVAIAIGAITGGLIGLLVGTGTAGIIGLVAGGVITGILGWLLTELLEVILEGIGAKAAEVVNDVSPDINIAVPGLELVLQEASIDDIKLHADVRVPQYAPVRCQGTLHLLAGQAVDFDSGAVGDARLFSADFVFNGWGGLQAQCNTRVARIGQKFEAVRRFMLYPPPYQRGGLVAFGELASFRPFPPKWIPSRRVFAYVTTEGRYGAFEVTEIAPGSLTLRYLTFGEAFPSAMIWELRVPRKSPKWNLLPTHKEALELAGRATFVPSRVHPDFQHVFPGRELSTTATSRILSETSARAAASKHPIFEGGRIGTWLRPHWVRADEHFYIAFLAGLGAGVELRWSVNGVAVSQPSGTLTIEGIPVGYEISGRSLHFKSSDTRQVCFSLELLAIGDNNQTARASRCVTLQATVVRDDRFTPPLAVFQKLQRRQFGHIEMDLPVG